MAFSLIASTVKASTDGMSATTSAINSTGANLLVIWTAESAEATPGVITDSKGNTWVSQASQPALTAVSGSRVRCWACLNPTSVGTSHTATVTGIAGDKPAISFEAYATGSTVASFDKTVGASTLNSAPVTSLATGSQTPSANNALVVTVVAFASNSTASGDSSFTALSVSAYTTNARGLATAYQVQTAATARNVTWSVAAPSAMAVSQVVFNVLSAGTGTLTVTKATVPAGSPQAFAFDAFATSAATLYTASGNVSTVNHPQWSPDGTLVIFFY